MKKVLTSVLVMFLIVPLAGCDEDDFFDGLGGFINKIENFVEDLDDDHDHGFGGITIVIGDDDDHFWDWW